MERISRVLTLLVIMLAFAGCITIEENYNFKKDGSGSMEYVVDMSEIGEMLKAMDGMDLGDDDDAGGMGTMDLSDELAALKAIPGIKKVKVNDKKEYVQKLKFNFANIDALNAALGVLMEDSTGREHTFFSWEGNTLVRTNNGHARQIGTDMGKDEDPSDSTNMTEFLATMKYKMSFRFSGDIAGTKTAESMIKASPDGRTVELETDFRAINSDPKALDLRIDLDQ